MAVAKDLTGRRFGRLVVIRATKERQQGNTVWLCRCTCPKRKYKRVGRHNLIQGYTKSCGCLQPEISGKMGRRRFIDLKGRRFGRLIVTRKMRKRRRGQIVWLCKCKCGNTAKVSGNDLTSGHTKSCRCLEIESRIANARNLTNQKFGRLVAIRATERRTSNRGVIWECLCECGVICQKSAASLIRGGAKSCNCLVAGARFINHSILTSDDISPDFGRALISLSELGKDIKAGKGAAA